MWGGAVCSAEAAGRAVRQPGVFPKAVSTQAHTQGGASEGSGRWGLTQCELHLKMASREKREMEKWIDERLLVLEDECRTELE